MKLEPMEIRETIHHLTITSGDDRRLIEFEPKLLSGYKYCGRIPTKSKYKSDKKIRSYEYFHEFRHLKTGNKVHVFVDRFNTPKFKTLFAPNITVKFFPFWESNLNYAEVVEVHNQLVEKYDVAFSVAHVHLALDLFFDASDGNDPFERVAGSIMSGRKVDRRIDSQYPDTYFFHSFSSMFCLVVYNKKLQLLREKDQELSRKALAALRGVFVTRIEFRFRLPHLVCAVPLEALATTDFAFLYPSHLQFLKPDREKLRKHGLRARDYKGLCLSEFRDLLAANGVTNNFSYYLREIESLAKPVRAALGQFRWERHPNRHLLSSPKLEIRKQRLKFIRHS